MFKGVPDKVKAMLVEEPAEDLRHLPWNRRRRRLLEKGGDPLWLHLYAGAEEGYTLSRAVKELGGDNRFLLEVDIQRGKEHDMVRGPLYGTLLRLAQDGRLAAVVGGPNCRTRSVLRHYRRRPKTGEGARGAGAVREGRPDRARS